MAVSTKAVKGRIKSVKSTKKITKAMEMVSAAKMRKAVRATLDTRSYAVFARELMEHLAHLDEPQSELLQTRPVKNILVVLISSNRGLCGSFNSNLFKRTLAVLRDTVNLARHRIERKELAVPLDHTNIHILGIGKKTAAFAKKYGYHLVAVYDALSERRSFDEVIPISGMILEEYKKRVYDKVVVMFTDYVSGLQQIPKVRQLLPISPRDLEKMIDELGRNAPAVPDAVVVKKEEVYPIENYLFEPNQETILEYVLPRLVEVQLFQAILESAASEHSARMMAMRNASDAANEMIDELQLSYNKARQATITREIAEIVGGAAALG